MSIVLDYLNSKGIVYKQAGSNNVHTACWYCNEDPSKRGRLYINVDDNMSPPGLFECKLCGESGALNKIRKHYGDPPLDTNNNVLSGKFTNNLDILRVAADYYVDKLCDNLEAFEWLKNERGLTVSTISDHKLGWADGKLHAHLKAKGFTPEAIKSCNLINADGSDFFVNKITIPYTVNGQVLQIRGKDPHAKYHTPPGDKVRPYNIDAARDADTVFVTEGEFDALVLEQLGYKAIGVPGANSWQEVWNGYVESAKKIYAVFDRDEAGAKGFEKLSKLLGARVRQVLMPEHKGGETKNDPSEWIIKKGHTASEFAALVSASNHSLLVSVNEAYSEWLSMEGNAVKQRKSLGFDLLDYLIDGGIQDGQVAIMLARTGTGKTIALINMFHRIISQDPSRKILFFSLEQTRNEWFDRALKIYSFYNPPKPKTLEDLENWRRAIFDRDDRGRLQHSLSTDNVSNLVDFYRNNLMIVDKNKVTEEDVRLCVEEFTEIQGEKPYIVAVDYLGYWARAFKGEAYERTTAAVMKLKEMGKDLQVPFVSPHQVNRGADDQRLDIKSSRDSGAVEETADFLFGLQRLTTQTQNDRGTGMKDVDTHELALDILKSRHGGKGSTVKLLDAPLSLVLLEHGDAKNKARAEMQQNNRRKGETLNDFYLRLAANYTESSSNWRELALERLEDELRS